MKNHRGHSQGAQDFTIKRVCALRFEIIKCNAG